MFERFTDRGRQALALAQDEARLLQHNFIGTEHLLLGLLRDDGGVAGNALETLGVTLSAAREKVRETIGPSGGAPEISPPFTPRSKKVLELSLREALQLRHNYIGTEHLLLGLVREGEGVGARVLTQLGATPERVREEVVRLLEGYGAKQPRGSLRGGQLVEMPPIGSRHDACVDRLDRMLQAQVGDLAIVRVHGSIALSSNSERQPDIAVLRWRDDFYAEELPGPRDVLLVVEVAESSADADREKAHSHARGGISETWVIDLSAGHIEEFSDPNPGGYAFSHTQLRGDKLRMAALPQVEVEVGDILV